MRDRWLLRVHGYPKCRCAFPWHYVLHRAAAKGYIYRTLLSISQLVVERWDNHDAIIDPSCSRNLSAAVSVGGISLPPLMTHTHTHTHTHAHLDTRKIGSLQESLPDKTKNSFWKHSSFSVSRQEIVAPKWHSRGQIRELRECRENRENKGHWQGGAE
jgi:hypothetical protein